MKQARQNGRIVTFYSYKGGTGRSMALANVAWILASHGRRVLAMDWDLEAPGLHRYFHPFLEDAELTESQGIIDYVSEFMEAARHARREPSDAAWYERFTSLLRYTYSLDWDFGDGTLDFVPAGQQGPGYALRVNGFDWTSFYEQAGGGVLLEAVKRRLHEDYDYVLIDSRTGISDTSGICTVQMPDDLVVCFTLNRQSIAGAAAVAESADQQRRRATGEPSLRLWPVPTRVELAEKDRLDVARELAQETFRRYIGHLPRSERPAYWSAIEILYQPYFAYEEVLAVFAERPRQKASMLSSLEALTALVTDGEISTLASMREDERLRGLELYRRVPPPRSAHAGVGRTPARVFISYAHADTEWVVPIARQLRERFGSAIWWEQDHLLPGDDWETVIGEAFATATIVLACFGPGWLEREPGGYFERQLEQAVRGRQRVIPLMVGGLNVQHWLRKSDALGLATLRRLNAAHVAPDRLDPDLARLGDVLARLLSTEPAVAAPFEPDDPQKGRWGGRAARNGRILSATVQALSPTWFDVVITVSAADGSPLDTPVEFHLHPSFGDDVARVEPVNGGASLHLRAWGAFTVGAVADEGRTVLELDLSEDPSFPELFRSR